MATDRGRRPAARMSSMIASSLSICAYSTEMDLSDEPAHPAIIDTDSWEQAQARLATKGAATGTVKPRRTPRPYLFRGVLFCGLCDRRMQAQWLRGMPYYRCRFPDQYATANGLTHPRNIYLREDHLVGPLDNWLLTALAPNPLHTTIEAMSASQPDATAEPQVDPIQQTIDDCDRKSPTTGPCSTPAPTRRPSQHGSPRSPPSASRPKHANATGHNPPNTLGCPDSRSTTRSRPQPTSAPPSDAPTSHQPRAPSTGNSAHASSTHPATSSVRAEANLGPEEPASRLSQRRGTAT